MLSRYSVRRPYCWIAQHHTASASTREGSFGSLRDQSPLLLSERSIDVKQEGTRLRAELSHDEGHALGHQTGNERDVTAEPIELSDDDRGLALLGRSECCGQLGPPLERVGPFPGLDLHELLS